MRDATGVSPSTASGDTVDVELWRAIARTVLRRAYTPSYDDLLGEIADFECLLLRMARAVELRFGEQLPSVHVMAAREALESFSVLLERMPEGVCSAASLTRVMARRLLRLCAVAELLDGGA